MSAEESGEACTASDIEGLNQSSSIDESTQAAALESTPNKKRNNSFARKKREQMRSRIKNSIFSNSKNTSLTCGSTDNLSDAANCLPSPQNGQSSNEKVPSLAISSDMIIQAAPATMPELNQQPQVSSFTQKGVFMRFSSFDNPEELEKERLLGIYKISGNFSDYYELQETLGEGCVGLVKKAIRKSDRQIFAVKTVRTRDEETIQNIKFEFTHLKQLNHQNIVKVYELYVDKLSGKIHSVMELIEGKEMFEVIHSLGHYSELVASRIFMQILDAIAYMHQHYCCHRDLKPNNILCNNDGTQVKITDFNVSKFSDHYKNYQPGDEANKLHHSPIKMWTYTGTMAFSAPEVFNGEMYDESIDMWSAGCILFTMLSGTEPFHAEYVNDLVVSICQGKYEFSDPVWNEVSSEAKDLISKCLTVNPAARIHPQDALKHPFITRGQRLSCDNQKCKEQSTGSQQDYQQKLCEECDKESNLCRKQLGNNIERLVVNASRKANPSRPRAVSSIFLQHGKFESQDKLFALLEQCCGKNTPTNHKSIPKKKQNGQKDNPINIYETHGDLQESSTKKRQRKYSVIFSNQDCFQHQKESSSSSSNAHQRKDSTSKNKINQYGIDSSSDTSSDDDSGSDQIAMKQKKNDRMTVSSQKNRADELFWSDAEGSLLSATQNQSEQLQQKISSDKQQPLCPSHRIAATNAADNYIKELYLKKKKINNNNNENNIYQSFKKRLIFSNYPLAYQEDLLQQQQRSFSCDLYSSQDFISLQSEIFNDLLKLKQEQTQQPQNNIQNDAGCNGTVSVANIDPNKQSELTRNQMKPNINIMTVQEQYPSMDCVQVCHQS